MPCVMQEYVAMYNMGSHGKVPPEKRVQINRRFEQMRTMWAADPNL